MARWDTLLLNKPDSTLWLCYRFVRDLNYLRHTGDFGRAARLPMIEREVPLCPVAQVSGNLPFLSQMTRSSRIGNLQALAMMQVSAFSSLLEGLVWQMTVVGHALL